MQGVGIVNPQLPPSPSGHPVIKHALQFARDPLGFLETATSECGDVYRIKLPGVDDVFVLAHPEYLHQALVTDIDAFGKTEDFRRAFGSGLLSAEDQQWRRQRETLQPLFFYEQIQGYTDEMVACTEQRLATWEEGETRDIEAEMRDLTLEVLFATLFGREMKPGEDKELREAADGLNDWFVPTSWILPRWLPTPARRSFNQSAMRLGQEVRSLLEEDGKHAQRQATDTGLLNDVREGGQQSQPLSANSGTHDLLTQLQQARDTDDNEQLSTQEIEDQLVTMVFAGHETTAAALAFTWYLLATHSDIREAFHEELDTVLDGASPSYEDLLDLPFTDRILTEALRLYPPVHTIPRQTEADVDVNGFHIPENREVHLSVIHVHRDERFYDDPLTFSPDRWMDGFEEELHDFAYVPFGGGRRACIGRKFALLEAKIVLATVGQRFQFRWEAGNAFSLDPRVTLRTEDGIPLRLGSR
ncbi:cytochrome P450 (plasmid) [Halocatena salina]|uniref:Cytochrome P450 n=2 Tax=Halocatena salina TaxID=2934340 RepID=A0A8U0A7B5_9EURY|nr:cytochrome P450 [Halocatena salina]UPM44739.1 cytochrome P450 [Halocatena salina]